MALRIMSSPVVRFAGPAARLGSVGRGLKYRTAIKAALEPEPPAAHRVGRGFISLYALAYMSTSLLFVAPLLVTLPLKVNSLVGIKQAPNSLALVAGVGALLAMFGWSPGNFVDTSIMLLLVSNCQIGARNPLGLSCRADVVSGRDCNIARCSRTRRS